jgi:hypothetical protein
LDPAKRGVEALLNMNALQNVLFKGKSLVVELSAENAYGYKFVCKKDEDDGILPTALKMDTTFLIFDD